jgi:acetylornithine deacetylase/succinyl-diaminopimelate desuccinylase-like protein
VPGEADEAGCGSRVMREIEACVDAAAAGDGWLRDHLPAIEWLCDFPPEELDRNHELVRSTNAIARRQVVTSSHLIGFDAWADQVMLMKEGSIPCVCFRPGSIGREDAVDEFVRLDDLAACMRIYADLAATWTAGAAVEPPAIPEQAEEDPWPR